MNLHKLAYILRSPDPNNGGEGPTPEEKAAQLEAQLAAKEAELEAERQKVKNQNSYITKLEADKKSVSPQPVNKPAVTPTPAPAVDNPTLSAAERYAINAATNEAIDKSVVELKAKYGEEAFAAFEEEFKQIARANIKDPFNIPTGLLDRAANMALGSAFNDDAKRTKILGAYVKTNGPQPQAQTAPPTQVIVNDPSAQKIGTMQPTDQPGLGPNNPVNPTEDPNTKKLSPREFFQSMRTKK